MLNLFLILVLSRKVGGYGRNQLPGPKKDVDDDSLGEIMGRLSPTDQARFHAVSKRWHSVRPITTYKSLPWFVSIDKSTRILSNSLECHLYDPYSSPKQLISTHKISLSQLGIPFSWSTDVLCNRQGHWLFISKSHRKWFHSGRRLTYFFLFSPLTRKFIQLPKLDYPFLETNFCRTFSTDPNSPDCVFLLLNSCDEPDTVVMTCRQSDEEWTIRKFDNIFAGVFCKPLYINATFLVVSPFGQVASYNIMNGTLVIEKLDRDYNFNQIYNSGGKRVMFELNGDLTMLYCGHGFGRNRQDNNSFPGIPCIKKFDQCSKAWVTLRSLMDQTLFVGDDIYSFVKVETEQARNMGVLPNAIYYYFNLGCIIYSFENGVLVQLKYNANKPVEGGDLLQSQYKTAITDWDERYKSYFWFEPFVIL